MILILSEQGDISTTHVIEWLDFFNKKWIRINLQDEISLNFIGNEIIFTLENNIVFKLSEIKSYWYRRGYFSIKNDYFSKIDEFNSYLTIELNKIMQFIHFKLKRIKNINSIEFSDVNKLIVNTIARDLNIKTPQDFIFSENTNLINLVSKSKNIFITKPIGAGSINIFEDFSIYNFSTLLDYNKIENINFFPSLVQNYIQKKYELRIFYLHGAFYSMAIFSQLDDKTSIDFRNYNRERPNRTVPYTLPNKISKKLDALMKQININCGSIDMIVTPKDEFVFLEVNPVGQFGMTSYPCNYNLEKKIAEYL